MSTNSSPPLSISSSTLEFYYYFSFVTLFLSWLFAPLLFYTILTQSTNMKNFKWLIFNHSFWCLLLETVIGIYKPLFLLPTPAGIPIGFSRYTGSFYSTTIASTITILFAINTVVGLGATIANRYIIIFPSKLAKTCNVNIIFMLCLISTIVLYGAIIYVGISALNSDVKEIYETALNSDPSLINFIANEPALIYVPRENMNKFIVPAFFCLTGVIIFGIFLIFYFNFLVSKHQKILTSEIQRSLIISSVMQILFTILFLSLPFAIICGAIAFNIPNTITIGCIFYCFLSSHCFLDFIVTLYFVSPYRNFVKNLLCKIIGFKFLQPSTAISVVITNSFIEPSLVQSKVIQIK